jgi:protoheme ferro-lyase
VKYTNAQAKLLEAKLREDYGKLAGDDADSVVCSVAMRYWKPFTDEVIWI